MSLTLCFIEERALLYLDSIDILVSYNSSFKNFASWVLQKGRKGKNRQFIGMLPANCVCMGWNFVHFDFPRMK